MKAESWLDILEDEYAEADRARLGAERRLLARQGITYFVVGVMLALAVVATVERWNPRTDHVRPEILR